MTGYRVQSQRHDNREHQAHGKSNSRKRKNGNVSAGNYPLIRREKTSSQKNHGQRTAELQKRLAVYELEQQKPYYAAYQHAAPEPGHAAGANRMRINTMITLNKEAYVVGHTLFHSCIEEKTKSKKPDLAHTEKLHERRLVSAFLV